MEIIYQLFTLAVLTVGCITGEKRGFTGQLASILGIVFGIGASGIMWHDTSLWIADKFPSLANIMPMTMYLPSAVACALLFGGFYLLFMPLEPAFKLILRPLGKGLLNRLAGLVTGVAKYALMLSFLFNMIIGADHQSALMTAALQGDGNIASCILNLAPALTGAPNSDELAYRIQLMEAKEFDRNHRWRQSVE